MLSKDLPLSSTQCLIGYQERQKHEPAIERSSTFVTISIQSFLSRQSAVKVTKVKFVHSVSVSEQSRDLVAKERCVHAMKFFAITCPQWNMKKHSIKTPQRQLCSTGQLSHHIYFKQLCDVTHCPSNINICTEEKLLITFSLHRSNIVHQWHGK